MFGAGPALEQNVRRACLVQRDRPCGESHSGLAGSGASQSYRQILSFLLFKPLALCYYILCSLLLLIICLLDSEPLLKSSLTRPLCCLFLPWTLFRVHFEDICHQEVTGKMGYTAGKQLIRLRL